MVVYAILVNMFELDVVDSVCGGWSCGRGWYVFVSEGGWGHIVRMHSLVSWEFFCLFCFSFF